MDDDLIANWSTQLRKGVLEFCILNALRGARSYGYDIAKRLEGVDSLVVNEGTIYPILSRFKRDGLVRTSLEESREGPARKYYELTERGERLLAGMSGRWERLKRGVDSLQGGDRP